MDVQSATPDLVLARIDDFQPTAVEERGDSLRIFFSTTTARDAALSVLDATTRATTVDVPDEDWARRSQENLQPVTVGRVTIIPSSTFQIPHSIVIAPSMGFGTGHHATTRLCLAALQDLDLTDAFVLDLGTGSGVLAIAADCLGARGALGVDVDPDAIQSARENLALNPDVHRVDFEVADLTARDLPQADVVTANLTGALLIRSAGSLLGAVRPGGTAILGGLLAHERDDVVQAFAPATIVWEREEDGWVGLMLRRAFSPSVS